MKKIQLMVCLFAIVNAFSAAAQTSKGLQAAIRQNGFTFYATSASPQNTLEMSKIMGSLPGITSSANIALNPFTYQVTLKKDTLIAYLPYYGKANSIATDPSNAGIKFKSSKFSYKEVKNKNGTWDLSFKTLDQTENQQFTLNVSESGYARLLSIGNNRSNISFSGYITANK